jgi:hypothetical protein
MPVPYVPTYTPDTKGDILAYPLAANAVIAEDDMVCYNSGGVYVVPASDASGLSAVLGAALEAKDNTGGADGALTVQVRPYAFLYNATSITDAMVGQMMFVTGVQTFDDTSTYLIPCGRLIKRVDNTHGYIDLRRKPTKRAWTFRSALTSFTHSGSYIDYRIAPYSTPQNVIIRSLHVALASAPGVGQTIDFCVKASCSSSLLQISGTATTGSATGLATLITGGTTWVIRANDSAGAAADPIFMLEGECYDPFEVSL